MFVLDTHNIHEPKLAIFSLREARSIQVLMFLKPDCASWSQLRNNFHYDNLIALVKDTNCKRKSSSVEYGVLM
jgi:hypothetical protein